MDAAFPCSLSHGSAASTVIPSPCLSSPACKHCSGCPCTILFQQFRLSASRFSWLGLNSTPRLRIPFAFRVISLRAAAVPNVFCFLHAVLLSTATPGCLGSALPSFFEVLWLRLVRQSYPHKRPSMWFLFVRPEVCPWLVCSHIQIPPRGGPLCLQPATGWIWVLHPLVTCPAGRTQRKSPLLNDRGDFLCAFFIRLSLPEWRSGHQWLPGDTRYRAPRSRLPAFQHSNHSPFRCKGRLRSRR